MVVCAGTRVGIIIIQRVIRLAGMIMMVMWGGASSSSASSSSSSSSSPSSSSSSSRFSPLRSVPYEAVKEACGALTPSAPPSGGSRGSLMQGRWRAASGNTDGGPGWLTALSETGTFQLSTGQALQAPLRRKEAVAADVSGHLYLGSPGVRPIPPPLILDVRGYWHVSSGDLCLACCRRQAAPSTISSLCAIRAMINLHYPMILELDIPITGKLEKINGSDYTYLLEGTIENVEGEPRVRATLTWIDILLSIAEGTSVSFQVRHVLVNPVSGTTLSLFGIVVQGGILSFQWLKSYWRPFLYPRRHAYRLLWASTPWVATTLAHGATTMSYWALVVVVLTRWVSHPHEATSSLCTISSCSSTSNVWFVGLSFPPYYLAWYFAFTWNPNHPLQTFAEILLHLWLLPQVISNFAQNLRPLRPLSPWFLMGVSACHFLALVHTHFRPRLSHYSDLFQYLPYQSFWPLTIILHLLVIIAFCQQIYGGRFFLPRYFNIQDSEQKHHVEL